MQTKLSRGRDRGLESANAAPLDRIGQWVRRGVVAFIWVPLLAFALASCAANPTHPSPRPAPRTPSALWIRTLPTIERVPVKQPEAFDIERPAELPVLVRGVNAADLAVVDRVQENAKRDVDELTGATLELGAQGLAMGGYAGAQIVTGAVFIAPLVITLDTMAKSTVNTITRVLKDVDLIGETRRALLARGIRSEAVTAETARVTLVVNAYGLVPKHGAVRNIESEVCLIVDSDLIVTTGGRELFRDAIHIRPYRRSADAPPPVCAEMWDFADKEGRSLQNAARDYAQVLAAIALHRIKDLPWRP